MSLRKIAYLAALTLLSACFMDPTPPPNSSDPLLSAPATQGTILLEDTQDPTLGTQLVAAFNLASDPATRNLTLMDFDLPIYGSKLLPTHDAMCQVVDATHSAHTDTLLDAGAITFGLADQTDVMTLPEDGLHRYSLKLDPNLPADTYQIDVAGTNIIPPFEADFALPEILQGATLNGAALGTAAQNIQRDQPIQLTWKAPTFMDARNIIAADIYADTAQGTTQVHCQILEDSLIVSSTTTVTWTIPAAALTSLPATNTGQIYLARAQAAEGPTDNLTVDVEALRSLFANIGIE